jgi:hypothetical protein
MRRKAAQDNFGGRDSTNPGYPSPLIFTKCDLPGRLKGLKKFIGLEKGANGKCVDQPKSD